MSPRSVSCLAARKTVRRQFWDPPRYSQVVDEDFKKPNKQTPASPSLVRDHSYFSSMKNLFPVPEIDAPDFRNASQHRAILPFPSDQIHNSDVVKLPVDMLVVVLSLSSGETTEGKRRAPFRRIQVPFRGTPASYFTRRETGRTAQSFIVCLFIRVNFLIILSNLCHCYFGAESSVCNSYFLRVVYPDLDLHELSEVVAAGHDEVRCGALPEVLEEFSPQNKNKTLKSLYQIYT